MRYIAYKLIIESELALPELLPSAANDSCHISIKYGSIPTEYLNVFGQDFQSLLPNTLLLRIPKVGIYLISRGKEILIDPYPGSDEKSIRLFLLGSVFGALLFQRGYLVLHGNAIRIGNQCIVCVGDSGVGKSTLTAGFLGRGYGVLADDVVAVDQQSHATPGYPRIKIWKDVADRLGISTIDLDPIRLGIDKFSMPLHGQFEQESLPIKSIYMLQVADHAKLTVEQVKGMDRFMVLRANTYRLEYMESLSLTASHLKMCSHLAGSAKIARITRPKNQFQLDALIDKILVDMGEMP